MLQKTHARLGDASRISFVSVTLYQNGDTRHLMIHAITDPEGIFDSANPRFLPPRLGGESFEIWKALADCFMNFEETGSNRASMKDSHGNLLTLFCLDNAGIIVGTETSDGKQEVEVAIEERHPHFDLIFNLFEVIGITNTRDPSKMVPYEGA
ncbi:MAG: hypothetical protein WAW13_04510 [Minisyncoccia bacterium]